MKYAQWLTLVLATALSSSALAAMKEPDLSVHKDTLFYDGQITKEGVKRFIALYDKQKTKPTLITIRSKGGDAESGMDFGDFVRAQQLSVRVMDYCISSCANYIFPAAKTKRLAKDAVIAWHGAVNSGQFNFKPEDGSKIQNFRCQTRETCHAEMARHMAETHPCAKPETCAEEREKLATHALAIFEGLAKREQAFFESIGVDGLVTLYGQDVVKCRCNWTFSVEDMRHFNINDVAVEDADGWHDWSWSASLIHAAIKRQVVILALPKLGNGISPEQPLDSNK